MKEGEEKKLPLCISSWSLEYLSRPDVRREGCACTACCTTNDYAFCNRVSREVSEMLGYSFSWKAMGRTNLLFLVVGLTFRG